MAKRLYYIFYIIQQSIEPVAAGDIQKQLLDIYHIHVDVKTIYQGIKNLNELFELFTGKRLIRTIRRKGYCIDEDYFDDGKLQYLLDSIIFNQTIHEKEGQEFIEQLTKLSSQSQLSRLNIKYDNHQSLNYDLLLNLTTIIKAINNHNNIYFKYISYQIDHDKLVETPHYNGNHKDDKQYYIVSPYKLILRDSKYYLIGYFDQRSDKLSIYRLDRMRLVRNHPSAYIDIQEQFDLEKELENNINMYVSGYKADLEIIFDQSILREVVTQFGNQHHVSRTFDNQYVMTIQDLLISDGLIGWLMMLQDKIEVVMPLRLKEEMRQRIEKMYNIYK